MQTLNQMTKQEVAETVETFQLQVSLKEATPFFVPFVREEIHTAAPKQIKPETIVLVSSPLSVLASVAVGSLICTAAGIPMHSREMIAAAVMSLVVGAIAVLPFFDALRNGIVEKMITASMFSVVLRMGLMLAAAFIAMGPGFHLTQMPLVYWMLGLYFPMLMLETVTMAWILRQADTI